MAWCNENSEIYQKINKHQNSTHLKEDINNYKREENLIDYNDMSCNTLTNFKTYLENTINLPVNVDVDYNSKSTFTPSLMYDVDQECNID